MNKQNTDQKKKYFHSTAVYHFEGSNAIHIHQRYVWRSEKDNKLVMNSFAGHCVGLLGSLIFVVLQYIQKQNYGTNVAASVVAFIVFAAALIILMCMAEVELRKRVTILYMIILTLCFIHLCSHCVMHTHTNTNTLMMNTAFFVVSQRV